MAPHNMEGLIMLMRIAPALEHEDRARDIFFIFCGTTEFL
jgi:hypothetical protein